MICPYRFALKQRSGGNGDDIHTTEITVYEYFVKHHNIKPRYSADLPCINVGGTQPGQEVWIPSELLELEEHQPLRGSAPEDIMGMLQPHAIRRPLTNANLAEGAFQVIDVFDVTRLQNLHVRVVLQMMNVNARMLSINSLRYGNGTEPGGAGNNSRLRNGRRSGSGRTRLPR